MMPPPVKSLLLLAGFIAVTGCGSGTSSSTTPATQTTTQTPTQSAPTQTPTQTTPTFQSQTYDLSNDFAFTANPNGVWQYGFSATNSLAPDQYRPDTVADTSNPIGFWHPTTSVNTGVTSGYYPYVAKNTTAASRPDPTNNWSARAGEITMEASGSGQYSLVRFVAPQAGNYQIAANFEGVHFNLSSTDVHVLNNGVSVFDANIDGYGGDPAFHAVQGSSPTASYSGTLRLNAGDILTFAVGWGPNQTNSNDTTGLFVHIVTVP